MKAQSTLVVAIPSDVRTLDPRVVEDTFSLLVCNQVFEGLVRFAEASIDVEPSLAESWSHSTDFRTWTFRLRGGSTFSDGSPLTTASVVESFANVKDYGGKCAAKGENQVAFSLDLPNSRFADVLAQMPFAVRKVTPDAILGSGPFRVVSRKIGREIILARNPLARDRASFENVTIRVVPFTTLLGKGIVEGDIDLTDSVTPAMLPILRKAPNVRLQYQMGLNTGFIAINTKQPHLSDPRIRAAIACAVDRAPILQRFFPTGYGLSARTLLPPDILPSKNERPEFHPFDPDKSRQLLQAAGYRGTPVRIRPTWAPRPYLPDPPAISYEISRMLKQVGFMTVDEPSPSTEQYSALKTSGDFDLIVAGWIADDTIPFTFLADNLLGARIGTTNIPRYSNPVFDSLLSQMRQSSGTALAASVDEAETTIARDVPLVPLFHGPQIAAAKTHVSGRILHPASALRIWALTISSAPSPAFAGR